MKDFFETVHNRASVRSFKPDRVTGPEWDALLRAAMAAPSAVNRQPWEFIIIEDRATLDKLADALPYAKMAKQASGAVVVCAVPSRAFEGKLEFAIIDSSLACENLLLAAEALGLGAVWTAVYPESFREAPVRELLGIPADIIPLAFVPVGRPAGDTKPKDKYRSDYIHRESW
jgi:nitroreductase